MINLENKNPDDIVYPCMFLSSVGEIELCPEKIDLSVFPETAASSRFGLNLSIFKEKNGNVFNLVYGVINTRYPSAPPQFDTLQVEDINGAEAKEFVKAAIDFFKPFKKSIIVFELRPYQVSEFNKIMAKWKSDFEEIVKKTGE